jgi:ribosomal-protein-serine acetyltransferase
VSRTTEQPAPALLAEQPGWQGVRMIFSHDIGGASLRILQPGHAEAFLAHVEADREHLARWLGWATQQQMGTRDQALTFIGRGLKRFAEDGLPWMALWQGDAIIGGVLYFRVDQFRLGTDIGYWLSSGSGGQGLATRMVRAGLRLAFEDVGLSRVTIQAEVDNAPSRRLAERVGFQLDGVSRRAWMSAGRPVDMAVYSQLVEEWRDGWAA